MALQQDQAQASEAAAIIAERKYQKELAQYNKDKAEYDKKKAEYDAQQKVITDAKAAEQARIAEEKRLEQEKADKRAAQFAAVEDTYQKAIESGKQSFSSTNKEAQWAINNQFGKGNRRKFIYSWNQSHARYNAQQQQAKQEAEKQLRYEHYTEDGFSFADMGTGQRDFGKAVADYKMGRPLGYRKISARGQHQFNLWLAREDLLYGRISEDQYHGRTGQSQSSYKSHQDQAEKQRIKQAQAKVAGYLAADAAHWQSVASGNYDAKYPTKSTPTLHPVLQKQQESAKNLESIGVSVSSDTKVETKDHGYYTETILSSINTAAANTKNNSTQISKYVTVSDQTFKVPETPTNPTIPVRTNTSSRKGVNEANILQKQYVQDLRDGKVGLAQALLQPQTPQRYSPGNTVNLKQYLTERGYDVTKPETIPDSVLMDRVKYDAARKQASDSSKPMGDLRKLVPNQPQVSDAVIQQRKETMEKYAVSKGGSFIGYGDDGIPMQGAPTPIKSQWSVDTGKTKTVTLPKMDGSTYTAQVPDPLLFDTKEQAQAYIDYQAKTNPLTYVSAGQSKTTEPSKNKIWMEDAYKYLDDSSAGLDKDADQGGILGNLYRYSGAGGAVGIAKEALAVGISVDNLASQNIAPWVQQQLGRQQPMTTTRPLIQSSESPSQVVFPYNFEEGRLKSGEEISTASLAYMQKYGTSDFIAGTIAAYYPGVAALKAVNPVKAIVKTKDITRPITFDAAGTTHGSSKIPAPTYVADTIEKTTYGLQTPSIVKTAASVVPVRVIRPGILDAAGQPTITHTALRFGYGSVSIPIGGKYKGGTFYRGQADDLEQTGLRQQEGASGKNSFDTHQVSHYTEAEIRELTPLVKLGEEAGIITKGEWSTLAAERLVALDIVKKQHKVFVDAEGKRRKFIEYKKSIDEDTIGNVGKTKESVKKGELQIEKKLFDMQERFRHKRAVKEAREIWNRREARKALKAKSAQLGSQGRYVKLKFVPPKRRKFKPQRVTIKEDSPGVLSSKYLGDTPIAQNEFGLLQRMHPALLSKPTWLQFEKTQKKLVGAMKGSGVYNLVKGGIKLDQHDIDTMSKVASTKEAQSILMKAKTKPGYALAEDGAGVGIGKKLSDDVIEARNIEIMMAAETPTGVKPKIVYGRDIVAPDGATDAMGFYQPSTNKMVVDLSPVKRMDLGEKVPVKQVVKHELIHKADLSLSEEAVLQLEKDPMGVTKAMKSGGVFTPTKEVEDVQEVFNIVTESETLTAATGKNTDAFYGKVRDTGDPAKIQIDGTKKYVTTQNFGQQHIDKTGSISGITSETTFKSANVAYDAEKLFPGEVNIRYGHALPHRHQKDVVDQYFYSSRYAAQQAWKTGNIKLAKEIGAAMGQRYQLEKSRGLNWKEAIAKRRVDGDVEFKFDGTPENVNKIDVKSGISTGVQSTKISPGVTGTKYKESESASVKKLDKQEIPIKPTSPRSATVRSTSPRTIKSPGLKSSTSSSIIRPSTSPKSALSPRSPKSPTSPKSPLSPKSPTSPKSPLSPKSPKSPTSPKRPSRLSALSPKPPRSPKSPQRRSFVFGMPKGFERQPREEKKIKRKDFLGSSRTDHIVGMFKRTEIISGDKQSAKQLARDKKFKEGKKKTRKTVKKESFTQKMGLINKGFKI